jgi:hypothetical protein
MSFEALVIAHLRREFGWSKRDARNEVRERWEEISAFEDEGMDAYDVADFIANSASGVLVRGGSHV